MAIRCTNMVVLLFAGNRGHRESNFQVDTISRSIVPTIVEIDIEIDIILILGKDSPNYALGLHVGNSA